MPHFPRPRTALLAVLSLTIACRGERAPDSAAETTAAGGATTTATADGATLGGDTAVMPGGAAGRPGPGTSTAGTASGVTHATGSALPNAVAPTGTAADVAAGTGTPTATATSPTGTAADVVTVPSTPSASLATGTPAGTASSTPTSTAASSASTNARAAVPFGANERLEFDVKFGAIDVGDAAMQLNGIETVRGHEVYHTVFRVSGGTLFFKVNDRYESWIDTRSLVSHRFVQQIDEGSYERERTFEIYPERRVYQENQKPEQATVSEPLDDGSFFYFVRTIPLEVGKTYTFDRYFKPASNPVTIKVLRKERVKVPAGTFDAVVIQPLIKTKGIFGEGGRAEIWLADDSTRAMLQMKSQLKFGSLNLYLKKYRMGARPVPVP